MIRLRDIANPVIDTETINSGEVSTDLPDSVSLEKFKQYIRIAHDSEDDNLKMLLLGAINKFKLPGSLGIDPNPEAKWKMAASLCGKRYVYLPRHNGGEFTTLNYNSDGETIEATWEITGLESSPFNLSVVKVTSDEVPSITIFNYPVGFSTDTMPGDIVKMIFIDAFHSRQFPFGADDRGMGIDPEVPAVSFIQAQWAMITDLTNIWPI